MNNVVEIREVVVGIWLVHAIMITVVVALKREKIILSDHSVSLFRICKTVSFPSNRKPAQISLSDRAHGGFPLVS